MGPQTLLKALIAFERWPPMKGFSLIPLEPFYLLFEKFLPRIRYYMILVHFNGQGDITKRCAIRSNVR